MRLLVRNIRYSYIDGMSFSIMLGATTPYLGVYILRFNGPPELVSLISSVQPFVLAIISLLAASYTNSFQKKKAFLMPPNIIMRTFFLVIAFIPFLPPAWHAWAFFSLWGIMYIPWSFCSLGWAPMMANIIPEDQRGRFFGTRNTITGITTLLGTLAAGMVIAKMPFNIAFTLIFIVSFIAVMISMVFLAKHIEPVVPEKGENKNNIRTNNSRIFELNLRSNLLPFKDPIYGVIFSISCLAIFIFHTGYSMAIPLFTLRQINQLHFNNTLIGIIATATGIAALGGSYVSGLISDRWGYRYVFLFSTLLLIIPPLIWAATSNFILLLVASMFWGFMANAYLICFQYMVLAVSPYKDRSHFVAMNTFTGNLAAGLGPVLGLFLTRISSVNIQGTLQIASVIMGLGSIIAYQVTRRGAF